MDDPYSNREIDEFHRDVRGSLSRLETNQSVGFTEVKARQDTTNGRVKNLEMWRAYTMGALSILTIIVIPLLGWALYILSNLQDNVHSAVDSALSAYTINGK